MKYKSFIRIFVTSIIVLVIGSVVLIAGCITFAVRHTQKSPSGDTAVSTNSESGSTSGGVPGGYPGPVPSNPSPSGVPGGHPGPVPSNPSPSGVPGGHPGPVPSDPSPNGVPGGVPGYSRRVTTEELKKKLSDWLLLHSDRQGLMKKDDIMPSESFRATAIRFPQSDAVKWSNKDSQWSQIRIDLDRNGLDDEKWLLKNGELYKREVLDSAGRTTFMEYFK